MGVFEWFDKHAGSIGTVVATVAAVATIFLVIYARRQIQEMLEARYNQSLPLILPLSNPPLTKSGSPQVESFDADAPDDGPDTDVSFQNFGTGPALNVWAVVFGPRPTTPTSLSPRRRTTILSQPISAGGTGKGKGRSGVTVLDGDVRIDGNPEHTLYAPADPTTRQVMLEDRNPVLVRYTITYRDVFGRRHASMFDFTSQYRWVHIGFFRIPKDLEELHRESYTNMMKAATAGATATRQQQPGP